MPIRDLGQRLAQIGFRVRGTRSMTISAWPRSSPKLATACFLSSGSALTDDSVVEDMTRSVAYDEGRFYQPRYDALVSCRVRLEWVFSRGARQLRLRVPPRTGRRHRGPEFRSGKPASSAGATRI